MNLSKLRNMMNRRSSILLALLLMLYSCQPKPRLILIKTGELVDTGSNTAIVQGFIIDPGEGITEHGHCWSTSSNPSFEATGKSTTLGSNPNSTFTSELQNLTPNSLYYVRAYATDGNTPPEYGEELTFRTNGIKPAAEFSASKTNIEISELVQFTDLSSNNPTSWNWDYGDGGSDTEQNPSHAYSSEGTYTMMLITANEFGSDTATKTKYIIVNKEVGPPPNAEFSASKTSVEVDELVKFTDLSSNNPTSWSWDYGDGSSDTKQNPSHAYNSAGKYTVRLTASNEFGSDTETKTDFIIVEEEEGPPPTAEFSASKTSVTTNESVQFTDLSGNNPTSWGWEFGDGSTSPEQNPSHAYSSAGIYTVKLTAANEFGSDTETKTDYIIVEGEVEPPPTAEFSASKTSVTTGESVQFTDLSGNNPTSWSWDFGDGSTSPEQNPLHAYSSEGSYTVILTASNESGSDTETKADFIIVGFACGTRITDPRDGKTYGTVQIGNQCWMAENLNVGERINGTADMNDNSIIEKYCYSDKTDNCDLYGGLYQWDEMMQYTTIQMTQGICPDGWHIPSDDEWKILEMHLGMSQTEADNTGWRGTDEGGKLKAEGTIYWTYPNEGATNLSQFNALPAGGRDDAGNFIGMAGWTDYWTSTYAWYRLLDTEERRIYKSEGNPKYGTSVRCVKD